jgi:hypothetical protein
MALARFFYKHRRSILAVLLWAFAILSFLQWQQRKIKRKWKSEKRIREVDYSSGDDGFDFESNLDALLSDSNDKRVRNFEKSVSNINIRDFHEEKPKR